MKYFVADAHADTLYAIAIGENAPEACAVTPGALARIKTLCKEHQVQQFVIGVSENQMAEMTQKFIELVKAECQLPVLPWDETLSSVVVKARLKDAHMSHRQPHAAIDHYAAATILEDWLESQ